MYGETLAIDDYDEDSCEGADDDEASNNSAWAQFIPLNSSLKRIVLQDGEDKYSFGKEDTDHLFQPEQFTKSHFALISKKHFIIHKQACSSDPNDYDVVLQDISSNGTLVNGKKVGKNKFHVLQSNDEISLALSTIPVYMYVTVKQSTSNFHSEVTEKYLVSKLLGKGACGEVYLVFLEADFAKQYAMKVVEKKSFTTTVIEPSATESGVLRNSVADVMGEVNILKKLKHPCIVHVQEVFDYSDRLYLVLERAMGGELFDRVVKHDGLSEDIAKLYFYQMLLAIEYLHKQNITHRDLKPENILLATEDDVTLIKVTDFGLSKLVGEQSLMKTLCGTPNYLAPEVIKTSGMGHYSSKVDIWSLGVILFIMLCGYPPFSDDYQDMPLVEQIKKARFSFSDDSWNSVSKNAKNMVSKLIVANANKRASSTEALKHPWLKDDEMKETAKKLMEPKVETSGKYESSNADEEQAADLDSSICSDKTTSLTDDGNSTLESSKKPKLVDQKSSSFKENSFETSDCSSLAGIEDQTDETEACVEAKRVKLA